MRVHFGAGFQGGGGLGAGGLHWAPNWKALTNAALDLDFASNKHNQTLGPERITNGTFDADITGWTAYAVSGGSAAGVVWDATGKLSITGNGAGSTGAYQAITTVVGATYDVTATNTVNNVNMTVNTAVNGGGATLATTQIFVGATTTIRFTATGTTSYVTFFRTGAVTSLIDNVSVKEVSPPLSRLLTTTRASAGMAQHSDGRWESFAANVPRITSKGLLVEESRTNSFPLSQTAAGFSTYSGTTFADGLGAPDGTNEAAAIYETTANTGHYVEKGATLAANQVLTWSVFVKPLGRNDIWLQMYANSYADSIRLQANVVTGVVTTPVTGTGAATSGQVIAYPNGWYRLIVTGTPTSAVVTDLKVRIALVSGSTTYTGETDKGCIWWGAQVEVGAFATSPIRTTAGAVTRQADVITGPAYALTAQSTMFAEVDVPQVNSTVTWRVAEMVDGSNVTNSIRANGSGSWAAIENADGAITGGPITTGTHKLAAALFANDVALSVDGNAPTYDTTATVMGTPVRFDLGNTQLATPRQINGYLRRLASWASRLSDANLIRLSQGQDIDTGAWAIANASLDMDFASDRYLGQHKAQLTVSRASPGMAEDLSGVWTSFGNNVPRITNKGLLVEEARTNSIRNSIMAGAVAGIPGSGGTAPTNWSLPATSGGLTRTIVGTGVSAHGLDYIDIRFQGTSSGYGDFTFEGIVTAAQGQTWTLSAFVRLVAGSTENISSINLILYGSPSFNDNQSVAILPTLSSSIQRFSTTKTFADVATTGASPRLSISGNGPVDITLRVSVPQLEFGAFATSPIRTLGSAVVTRQAETITLASLGPWFNAATGVLYAEALGYDTDATHSVHTIVSLDDTTGNERMQIRRSSSSGLSGVVVDGGAVQANPSLANAMPLNTYAKSAFVYATDDFALISGAVAPSTDNLGTLPTVTTLRLGFSVTTSAALNGYIKRAAYIPSRVSNATLQALTA